MPISGVLGCEVSARVLLRLQPVLRDQFEKLDPDPHLNGKRRIRIKVINGDPE